MKSEKGIAKLVFPLSWVCSIIFSHFSSCCHKAEIMEIKENWRYQVSERPISNT